MNRESNTSTAGAPLREALPPRRQWNPLVVAGVKRVRSGEDPDKVALDIAFRVPGFKRSDLGVYTAAYDKSLSSRKKVKEGLFSANEPDVAARDNKEQAVQALLGTEDVDVKKVPDEDLSSLIQGLGSITTESIDSQVAQIISVMREQKASRNDVIEALQVHIGFNLREAKEVLQEHLREADASKEVKYGVYRKGGSTGTNNGKPVKVCDTAEEAKEHAKRLRKQLSPGEKGYYKLGYTVKPVKEATDISYYMRHARELLQGVHEIAGLDPEMAALCFAIWNLKLARTEEDPTAELVDMWSSGEGAISLKNGRMRRPGPKEAEALPALIQGMNDIIADREENLNIRESTEYPSEEFARALNKARVAGLSIPDLDALYDMVYDRISEEGEAFKDVLRYKATEKDIYDTIADIQE